MSLGTGLESLNSGALVEPVTVRKSSFGGAIFDPTNRHRYLLWRNLTDTEYGGHAICFIMLNPNRADELSNDPTIKRCIGFAKGWGFHKILVVNLFSVKASTPSLLRQMRGPLVGPSNDSIVLSAIEQSSMVVAAWGNHGTIGGRDQELLGLVEPFLDSSVHGKVLGSSAKGLDSSAKELGSSAKGLYCLGLTKLRQPKHPLYLRSNLEPVRFIR